MKTNLLKTGLIGLALVALLGVPTTMADESQSDQSIQVTWDWLPANADDFLNGAVGNVCSGGTYQLSEADLLELFPMLDDWDERSHAIRTVGGCENHCSCGACIVVDGQVACTACYSCCVADSTCDAQCSSDLSGMVVTSHCSCTPSSVLLASVETADELVPSEALGDGHGVTSLAPGA